MFDAKQKMITTKVTLWTESFGNPEDPACLLICGAGAPAKFWTAPFCQHIAERGFFVIRYDHRDQGLSSSVDFDDHPYSVKDLADDAVAILDAYKINKAHVVGHSMGGTIAQLLAIYHPQRILSMTSLCVSTVGEGSSPPQEVMDVLLKNNPTQDFEADLPGFMNSWKVLNGEAKIDKKMATAYTKDFYERSIAPVEIAWNHIRCQESLGDITEGLKKTSTPSLFIAGEKDVMMSPERVRENSEIVPNARFVSIPKMGHMFFNKDIEIQLADTILETLENL